MSHGIGQRRRQSEDLDAVIVMRLPGVDSVGDDAIGVVFDDVMTFVEDAGEEVGPRE